MAGTVVERLIIEIGGDAKKFKKELDSLKKANKDGEASFKKLALVGKASFLAIAAAATAMAVVSTKSFIAFEKGVTNVAKTTNLAGQELEDFKKEIMDLSEAIPVTVDQLLAISVAAGQLGIKGTENLIIFTETIAKLGATTDLEGEQAAIGIARILNLTNEGTESVDEFGSAIVDLGNNFATSESQILSSATELAKATVNFKLSSPEILGMAAAMSSLGIAAEAGSTVVGKAFMAIDEAVRAQAGPAFEKLVELTGMTGEELEKTFKTDATAVFQSFIQGLGEAGESGKSMVAELDELGLSGIRVQKILPTLAERSDILSEALDRSGKAAKENSALNKEAATAFETTAAKLQVAQNKINNVLIEMGAEIAPAFADAMSDVADTIKGNRESIKALGVLFGGLVTVLAKIVVGVGNVVSIFTSELWPTLDTTAEKLANATEKTELLSARFHEHIIATRNLVREVQKELNILDKNALRSLETQVKISDELVKDKEEKARIAADIIKADAELQKKVMADLVAAEEKTAEETARIRNDSIANRAFAMRQAVMEQQEITDEANAKRIESEEEQNQRLKKIREESAANRAFVMRQILAEISESEEIAAAEKLTAEEAAAEESQRIAKESAANRAFAMRQAVREQQDITDEANAEKLKSEQEFGETMAAIKEIQRSSELKNTKTAAGELAVLINSENDTLKSIGKAATIIQIGISTAESAIKTFNALAWIPVVGFGLGIAGAAAVTAFGAEQINNVRQMKEGGLVPGSGRGDKVPALLEPGELVVPRDITVELMKRVGARQMADGGVASGSGENKDLYNTFADIFNPMEFIKDLVYQFLGWGGIGGGTDAASGFGSDLFGGMVGGVSEMAQDAVEELADKLLDNIPGGEILKALRKAGVGGGIVGDIVGGLGFQKGGIVPGPGSGDIVPAFLDPGTMVLPKGLTSSLLNISSGFGSIQTPTSNQSSSAAGSNRTERVIVDVVISPDEMTDFISAKQREQSNIGISKQ